MRQYGDPDHFSRHDSIHKHYFPEPKPAIIHDYVSEDASEYPPDQIEWGRCKEFPPNVLASDACVLFSVRVVFLL